jgi:putative glutamine amidotransferase
MKKRIGISFSKTNFQNYWTWFTAEDLQEKAELVELSFLSNNEEAIASCDGFILTGGIDISPDYYSGTTDYNGMPEEFQKERDQFEEKIFRFSQSTGRPLLGICRGLQLVNVFQGGKLIQDLGPGNDIHKKISTDKEHTIRVEQGTILHVITGTASGTVNSAHHQAIDPGGLGENLKINAFATTGDPVIEGIEFDDKSGKAFMLCVQWHPERLKQKEESPFSILLKKRFLEEVNHQI